MIAIGLVWRDGWLLAAEVLDDADVVKGVRPLGGEVDFSERWQDALIREFREEMGCNASVSGPPIVLENIYRHAGQVGHEIAFAADTTVPNDALPGDGPYTFWEDNGVPFTARWVDPRASHPPLYPEGLATALDARARAR